MKTVWQQCEGDFIYDDHYVSINRRGEIAMSFDAYGRIREPVGVALLWDAPARRIGVKAALADDGWHFPVGKCGRGGRTLVIRAARLLKKFDIKIERTLRFRDVYWETLNDRQMLILDLNHATPVTRNTNGGRNKTTQQEQL